MSKMKSFLGLSFITVLFLWAVAASPAEKTVNGGKTVSPQEPARVLYDFRRYVDVTPKLSAGEERRILHRIFPKYLRLPKDCGPDDYNVGDNRSQEDIKAGQIAPTVNSVVHGAFTGPGRKETAYLVFVGECHVARSWTSRLVVVDGDRIVMQQEVPELSIKKTFDLDGDGVQELLLEGGFTNMGETDTNARLLSLSETRLKVIKDFEQVSLEDCEGGRADSAIRAVVITYQPKGAGAMPEFASRNYEAKCPAKGAKADFKPIDK